MLDDRIITFLTVCKYSNFTKAAYVLNLTQPAVSQHIKYLEDKYDTKLFIRDKKNITLTPAGKILFTSMESMRNDEHRILKKMKQAKDNKNSIQFGATMTIGDYEIISILPTLIQNHPNTNFSIQLNNTHSLLQMLQEGDIDFAFVEGNFSKPHYMTKTLKKEPYIAVCSAQHTFKSSIHTINDLLDETLILREKGSGTRQILSNILSMENLSPSDFSHTIEIGSIPMILQLLKKDYGITFLYKTAIQEELQKGILKEIHIDDFHVYHDFTCLWNKESIFSKEYEQIFNEIQQLILQK